MKKKHSASYLVALFGIAIALAFVMLSNGSNALAQQQNNTANGVMMALMPNGQQTSQSLNSMRMNTTNWTSSISLFSSIIDAFKLKIHTTLNDATTNALKAVGGGLNSSAVAAFIHPERGFLVYDVFVLDSNDNVHRVLVDPGNGKVLSNQSMSLMDMMGMVHPSMGMMMGGPGMMCHGMMMQPGMMGGPEMMGHGMMGMMKPNMMGMMNPGMMMNPNMMGPMMGMMGHGMGVMGPQNNPWP